jgi:hypothetical protein
MMINHALPPFNDVTVQPVQIPFVFLRILKVLGDTNRRANRINKLAMFKASKMPGTLAGFLTYCPTICLN